jgi:HAMP domain-containing protein
MVRTDDPGQARVIASLDSDEVGHLHDMSGSAVRTTGWETLSVEETPGPDADEPVVRAYVPIRDRAGEPVAVMRLDADQRYFDALITEAVVAAILIFVIAMTFSMLFTATFSRQMARPVETLVRGMDAVAAGNLSVRVPAPGTLNEMDRLSKHFNTMVGDLRDRERMQRDVGTATEVQVRLLPRRATRPRGLRDPRRYEVLQRSRRRLLRLPADESILIRARSAGRAARHHRGRRRRARTGLGAADDGRSGPCSDRPSSIARADLVDAVSSVNRQMLHDEAAARSSRCSRACSIASGMPSHGSAPDMIPRSSTDVPPAPSCSWRPPASRSA